MAGAVQRRRVSRQYRFFSQGWEESLDEDLALIQHPSAMRIAMLLVEHPGIGVAELVARSGFSQRVVYHHVKAFREAGLIEAPGARHRGLRATPRLHVLLTQAFPP